LNRKCELILQTMAQKSATRRDSHFFWLAREPGLLCITLQKSKVLNLFRKILVKLTCWRSQLRCTYSVQSLSWTLCLMGHGSFRIRVRDQLSLLAPLSKINNNENVFRAPSRFISKTEILIQNTFSRNPTQDRFLRVQLVMFGNLLHETSLWVLISLRIEVFESTLKFRHVFIDFNFFLLKKMILH